MPSRIFVFLCICSVLYLYSLLYLYICILSWICISRWSLMGASQVTGWVPPTATALTHSSRQPPLPCWCGRSSSQHVVFYLFLYIFGYFTTRVCGLTKERSWTRPCCSLYLYLCGCSVLNCQKLHVWHSNGQSWYKPLYSVSLFVSHQNPLRYKGVEVDCAQNSMSNVAVAKVNTTLLYYPGTFSCSLTHWQVVDTDQDWRNDNTWKTCHANSKG